jgi:sialic acid synthase
VRELVVDGRIIARDGPAFVIAEIGHNHQGDVEKAKALVRSARECGADAVKLQKRDNGTLYTRALYEAPYDNEHSFGRTYGKHRQALELSAAEWLELREFSREEGITLFGTVFDEASADLLHELDMPAFKIASGDLTNTPLIRHVAGLGRPIFLSTGGGTMGDVERAVDTILPLNSQLCVMQCTASYPCEVEELNLGVIGTYRERFDDLVIGLSDHQSGIAMSLVGYMLGARVIEKHFTLNHAWKGSDHAFSLMPEGMRRLVRDLHRVPDAVGDGVKRPLQSEERALEKMGKKLVAARDLASGHILVSGDLVARSPADEGLPPYELDDLIGRALARAVVTDQAILAEDLEPAAPPVAAREA